MSLFHGLPGMDIVLSFLGCLVIVAVSKFLGTLWLQRPENHYEDADD